MWDLPTRPPRGGLSEPASDQRESRPRRLPPAELLLLSSNHNCTFTHLCAPQNYFITIVQPVRQWRVCVVHHQQGFFRMANKVVITALMWSKAIISSGNCTLNPQEWAKGCKAPSVKILYPVSFVSIFPFTQSSSSVILSRFVVSQRFIQPALLHTWPSKLDILPAERNILIVLPDWSVGWIWTFRFTFKVMYYKNEKLSLSSWNKYLNHNSFE